MTPRTLLTALSLALLGGCTIDPASGTWEYDPGAITENTCEGDSTIVDPPGQFELENDGGGTFTIEPNDDSPSFQCALSGADFECPARLQERYDFTGQGIDAVVTIEGSAQGTFSSDTEAEGSQRFDADCEGSDCGLAPAAFGVTLPCGFTQPFSATLRE